MSYYQIIILTVAKINNKKRKTMILNFGKANQLLNKAQALCQSKYQWTIGVL